MFVNVTWFELNKQKRNALSVLLIIAIALCTALVHAVFRPGRLMDLLAVLSVAAVYCIPVIGLVFGIAAAAGIRNEQRLMAEEMLPFSPRQRVLGAYGISLLLLTALSVFFVTACWWAGELMFLKYSPLVGPYWILILAVLYLHLLAFTLTYWTGQPLLGGGLAVVCAALTAFCLVSLMSLYDRPFFEFSWEEYMRLLLKGAVLVPLATFAALWILPPRIEQNRKLRFVALIVGALLCLGPVLAFGALLRRAHQVDTQLLPLQNWNFFEERTTKGYSDALFATRTGSIVRIAADGSRQLIHRAEHVLLFQRPAFTERIVYTVTDSAHRLWVLSIPDTRQEHIYELQKMEPGGVLEPYSTFRTADVKPRVMLNSINGVLICGYFGSGNSCAPLPAPGKAPEWSSAGLYEKGVGDASAEMLNGPLYEIGKVALLSRDNSTLSWKKVSGEIIQWDLPGKAELYPVNRDSRYVAPVYFIQGEPVFGIAVQRPDKQQQLLLCFPDGSISNPWNRTWGEQPLSIRSVLGGTLWLAGAWNDRTDIIALSSEGDLFPAVEIPSLFKQAGLAYPLPKTEATILLPLRIINSQLWIVLQNRIIQIDLGNTRIIRQTTLFSQSGWMGLWNTILQPTQQGMYFISEGRIHLMAWDGKVTDLGKAAL